LTWTNFRLNVDFFVQKIGLWTERQYKKLGQTKLNSRNGARDIRIIVYNAM
jgi:hypothetical protein